MSKLFSSFPGSLFCHGNALRDSFGGMNEGMRVYNAKGPDSGKGALEHAPSVDGWRERMGGLLVAGRRSVLAAALALGLGSTVACNDDGTTDLAEDGRPEEDGDTTGGSIPNDLPEGGETTDGGSDSTDSGMDTSGETTDTSSTDSGTDTSGDTTGTGEEFPAPPEVLIDTLDWGCEWNGCAANGDGPYNTNEYRGWYTGTVQVNYVDPSKLKIKLEKSFLDPPDLNPPSLPPKVDEKITLDEDGVTITFQFRTSDLGGPHKIILESTNNMGNSSESSIREFN